MSFRESFRNIRYFFKWMAEVFRTWFTPYHYDENDEEDAATADNSPDKTPKPSPSPAEATEATDGAVSYEDEPATSELSEVLAFRGAMTQTALGAVLGKNSDDLTLELESLMDYSMIEDVGDGRYLLLESERRRILRADPQFADWLSRLQHTELEDNVLEILEQLCRQLPVKILAGQNVVIHVRQRKWMIWQSREDVCRVKMFGTLDREEWPHLREIDRRARRFRRKGPHRWDPRDWVSFRWRVGADTMAIESFLLETGRQFQNNTRRRRKSRRRGLDQSPAKSASDSD